MGVNLVLGFFYSAYTARYLGAAGYGTITFALALTNIFGILTDLGLSQLAVREISRDKALSNRYIFNLLAIKLILIFITFLLIAITANLMADGDTTTITVVYIIGLSICISAIGGVFSIAFQAFERMEYSSVANVLNGAMMLSGALVALHYGFGVVGFACIYLFTSSVGLAYSLFIFFTRFSTEKTGRALDLSFWSPLMREALPFGLTSFFVSIYFWIDSVMLFNMKGDDVVGLYNAAYRLIIVLLVIPSVVNTSLFPVMSRYFMSSKNMLRFVQQRSFRYLTVLGLPIGVGTTLLADRIIVLIYGTAFSGSSVALQILVWAAILSFIGSAFSRLLGTSNRQTSVTKITAVCAAENVLLNLLIIPRLSYIGASLTTVAAEITSLLLCILASSKIGYGLSKDDTIFLVKVLLANAAMAAFVVCQREMNLALLVPLSAILYFVVAYMLNVFDRYDMEILRDLRSGRGYE